MDAIGENWDCPTCGKKMTPHGDCVPCMKKEKARAFAAGEMKRAKDIVVGDVISSHWSFKINPVTVKSVEHTPKGKVVINRGMGYMNGEDTFWAEQVVDIVFKAPKAEPIDQIIKELEDGLDELGNLPPIDVLRKANGNTKPEYYWPLHRKVVKSALLILLGLLYVFIIIWLKVGAFLGVKSYKNRYVPVLFCGLVPVFHAWDHMWKINPPSHY
jgi:hypothetical protein